MKYLSVIKQSIGLLLLAVLAVSCIKEDLDACYKLTLSVQNAKGDDVTELGVVTNATIYIFDDNQKLLATRTLDKEFITSRKEITLTDYPGDSKLHIVAWGNLAGGHQDVTNAKELTDLKVMLKNQNELAQSPDKLYYGNKDVELNDASTVTGGNQEIVVRCKVGDITMDTRGLENVRRLRNLKSTDEFGFYMDRTLSGFDHAGQLIGDSVYYNPDYQPAVKSQNDIETIEPNNVVTGEKLKFRLEMGGQELAVRDTDDDGNPFYTTEENNTHVRFTFDEDGNVSVKVKVTPWGTVDDNIEF